MQLSFSERKFLRDVLDWLVVWVLWHINHCRYYLPTPPLGQDMTQGQFLSGV